jgi:ArsR family transcriptional regulator
MSNNRYSRFDQLSSVFRALSNPNRLMIFMQLASCCRPGTVCDGDEAELRRCVGDLGRELGISPSTISHHLKELRAAGLIKAERAGQNIECWVDPEILQALSEFFSTPLRD